MHKAQYNNKEKQLFLNDKNIKNSKEWMGNRCE